MRAIRDAAGYPIRDGAWAMLVGGAALSLVVQFFARHNLIFGLAALALGLGYFAAYMFAIVDATLAGSDDAPNWPSFREITQDLLVPFFRMLTILLLSFGPLAIVELVEARNGSDLALPYWLTVAYGCLYMPMAVVATCAFGTVFSALPHVVLPAITRVLPHYLVPVATVVLAYLVLGGIESAMADVPFLGGLLAALVGIYALMFESRSIGLLYRAERAKLDWDVP